MFIWTKFMTMAIPKLCITFNQQQKVFVERKNSIFWQKVVCWKKISHLNISLSCQLAAFAARLTSMWNVEFRNTQLALCSENIFFRTYNAGHLVVYFHLNLMTHYVVLSFHKLRDYNIHVGHIIFITHIVVLLFLKLFTNKRPVLFMQVTKKQYHSFMKKHRHIRITEYHLKTTRLHRTTAHRHIN